MKIQLKGQRFKHSVVIKTESQAVLDRIMEQQF